jgi:chromosome segregation ATPase
MALAGFARSGNTDSEPERTIMRDPKEPDYSCPNLDSAISEIEKARSIHDELRSWGKWWEERAHQIEKELSDEIDEYKKDIKNLEERIQELEQT